MPKIDTAATGVWCPAGHWLGAIVNLTTGRDLYCSRCGRWYAWQELDVGKKREEEKK